MWPRSLPGLWLELPLCHGHDSTFSPQICCNIHREGAGATFRPSQTCAGPLFVPLWVTQISWSPTGPTRELGEGLIVCYPARIPMNNKTNLHSCLMRYITVGLKRTGILMFACVKLFWFLFFVFQDTPILTNVFFFKREARTPYCCNYVINSFTCHVQFTK